MLCNLKVSKTWTNFTGRCNRAGVSVFENFSLPRCIEYKVGWKFRKRNFEQLPSRGCGLRAKYPLSARQRGRFSAVVNALNCLHEQFRNELPWLFAFDSAQNSLLSEQRCYSACKFNNQVDSLTFQSHRATNSHFHSYRDYFLTKL